MRDTIHQCCMLRLNTAGDPWEEAVSDMLRTNALMHMVGMRPLLREYVVIFYTSIANA